MESMEVRPSERKRIRKSRNPSIAPLNRQRYEAEQNHRTPSRRNRKPEIYKKRVYKYKMLRGRNQVNQESEETREIQAGARR